MNTPRRIFPFVILTLLALLISAASSPNPQARWVIDTIDALTYFKYLTPSMFKVINDIPSAAFGGDHLYYAKWNADITDIDFFTVDDSPGVGSYASLAQDVNGNTFISYYDSINTSLKFATQEIDGLGWQVETVDATTDSGRGSAIAALEDGQPHISYLSGSTLKYTQRICSGYPAVCVWSIPVIVDTNVDTNGTSIAITSADIPHIAYVDLSGYLKHAYKVGTGGNCGAGNSWYCESIIGHSPQGTPSIALWDNKPRIAYYGSTNGLHYLSYSGAIWNASTPHGGNLDYGLDPSLVIDTSGIPHISYRGTNGAVWYAVGSSIVGGGPWTTEAVGGAIQAGQTAIAFNQSSSNYPCILYYSTYYQSGFLGYTCKTISWTIPHYMFYSSAVGKFTSLALDTNGQPYITYQARVDHIGVTRVATWSTQPDFCESPYGTGPWRWCIVNNMNINFGNGFITSVAINPLTGYPAVSYLDRTGVDGLGYAWYVGSGGNCVGNSSWTCTIIYRDVDELPGYEPSLAFSSDGIPVIAFSTGNNPTYLGLARFVGSHAGNCTDDDWECGIIDTPLGDYGGQASLALTSTGKAVISYNDSNLHRLRLAMEGIPAGTGCNGTTYPGSWKCMTLDPNLVAGFTNNSLALLSDTEAGISYSTNSLGVLQFVSVVMPDVVDEIRYVDANHAGYYNSMALYRGGPWIAYSDGDTVGHYTLRLAHWVGVSLGNCGSYDDWQCEVLDDAGSVGQYPSIKISDNGAAYISYYDDANGDLKIAYTRLFNFMPLLLKP